NSNRIKAPNGYTILDLENNDKKLCLMTCHEYDESQDDAGIYGTTETIDVTLTFIKNGIEAISVDKFIFAKTFLNINLKSYTNGEATVDAINSTINLSSFLFKELRDGGYSKFGFDVVIPNGSQVKSLVTVFRDLGTDEVRYNATTGCFSINSLNVIHVQYLASDINALNSVTLFSRDIPNGYSGADVELTNAVIKNFVFVK
ncbi:MAG: hypothetical protein HUJ61_02445, partial [Bacilli bacterium]|nr:hypothetical protein [Bacilli bacterium]